MNSLQKMFPEADVLVIGCLGPKSNAHCPDESLDLAYFKRFLAGLSHIVACHGAK
jgi:hypothetical protein